MPNDTYDPAFETLLAFLKDARGFDFTGYKRPSLMRRVRRRMQTLEIDQYSQYQDYLEANADEFVRLFNTILINVTRFFRDPEAWKYVADTVLPRILSGKADHEPIRVWSAGCASGEETYSAAIMLADHLGEKAFEERVKIYATDVDEEALGAARQAAFTDKQLETLGPNVVQRYFEPSNGHPLVFRQDLRRQIIFGRHDLVQDAPISRIDLLICRNTLMYFSAETQARILTRFHFALQNTGHLFLGKVEMLLGHPDLFTPLDLKHRVFAKVPRPYLRQRLLDLQHADQPEPSPGTAHRLAEFVFDASPLAQVAVDAQGFLVLASAKARAWFGLNPSDVGRPFQDLELSYRPTELRSSIEQVRHSGHPVRLRELAWRGIGDGQRHLDVELAPGLDGSGAIAAVILSFVDVSAQRKLEEELQHANNELEGAYEEIQSTNEELETTNEELQSTVEELETTNEELQSTNEELETMNEELQSTNDELHGTNDTLRVQAGELDNVNAFMESILESLGGAIVVVDRELRVQVWNGVSEDLWGLRTDEVVGSNLLSLDIGLPLERLAAPLRRCLNGTEARQVLTLDAHNRRGQEFRCRVRCSALERDGSAVLGAILLLDDADGQR
jgi:two-component system CheB/CheR fusion protein